jgi:hypothetical protein
MTSRVLAVVLCLVAAPAFARGDLKIAPVHLSLQIVSDKPGERCARSGASDPAPLVAVSISAYQLDLATNLRREADAR